MKLNERPTDLLAFGQAGRKKPSVEIDVVGGFELYLAIVKAVLLGFQKLHPRGLVKHGATPRPKE
jgi:hypothetical protein